MNIKITTRGDDHFDDVAKIAHYTTRCAAGRSLAWRSVRWAEIQTGEGR